MPDYREISLNLDRPLGRSCQEAVEYINARFDNSEEIALFPNGQSITIHLREIDLRQLEMEISKIVREKTSPLLSVCDEIRKIGSYGIKGNKRQYVGFNKERKVKNRSGKERARGKHYYADENAFSKQNQTLPARFQDKIICDDSEQFLKKLPDNCIDLVFTSPPYNFGLDYAKTQDAHFWEQYFEKLFKVFDECIRVVKYGGRIVVNIQPLFSDYIPSHHIVSQHFIKRKLIWKGEILWEKNNYNCKYTAWGSWKSPSNPYLKYTWEFLEIFCKGSMKKQGEAENADISAEEFKKWVVGKWSIAPERRMKEYDHPAMFPEALAERVIKLFSFKGDIVLDPFLGVGTSCVAAKRFNRHYLGVDISPRYCKTAESRVSKYLL